MASSWVFYKDRARRKLVGLLIGKHGPTDRKAYGEDIYQEFRAADVWPPPVPGRRRSSTEQTMQDRLGFHTFRRGDFVEYLEPLHAGEQPVDVIVFGVCYHEAKESGAPRRGSKWLQPPPAPSNPPTEPDALKPLN